MLKRSSPLSEQRGASLIEAALAIALVACVAAPAALSFGNAPKQSICAYLWGMSKQEINHYYYYSFEHNKCSLLEETWRLDPSDPGVWWF